MPKQSAPQLRRTKRRGSGGNNGPIWTMFLMVIGILVIMGVGFLLEMAKQQRHSATTTTTTTTKSMLSQSSSFQHISL
eukprot:CAMPEP_0178929552 /NCGR_PEP_ID=MMETSP0786-20121207/20670_1 /TAXON_ID=186022 /ORGANISM="Thalassionema frauenfeldii, Strain CCMP 1798" /LENGTH=77 /DNA_ID=CAMNT_0020605835 /DNA_START=51 /DNA_END=280 /DNA_ORIENTATION=+